MTRKHMLARQAQVLRMLNPVEPVTIDTLAERLEVERGAITRTGSALEKQGLVERRVGRRGGYVLRMPGSV